MQVKVSKHHVKSVACSTEQCSLKFTLKSIHPGNQYGVWHKASGPTMLSRSYTWASSCPSLVSLSLDTTTLCSNVIVKYKPVPKDNCCSRVLRLEIRSLRMRKSMILVLVFAEMRMHTHLRILGEMLVTSLQHLKIIYHAKSNILKT